MAGSGATVGPAVGGGRVPAPGGAVIDPGGPGLVLFVILCLTKLESLRFLMVKDMQLTGKFWAKQVHHHST